MRALITMCLPFPPPQIPFILVLIAEIMKLEKHQQAVQHAIHQEEREREKQRTNQN